MHVIKISVFRTPRTPPIYFLIYNAENFTYGTFGRTVSNLNNTARTHVYLQ